MLRIVKFVREFLKRLTFLSLVILFAISISYSQTRYNHPELEWRTFETAHFKIHYHEGAHWTASRAAEIAEAIYGPVTSYYDYEPDSKTHLILKDTDDISNGAAYYYDNKIEIWATPLDFLLRGNHDWLRDVITHEFTHIVSLQKSMKFTRTVPAFYLQCIDYEEEKREDVIYGYPRVICSYPIPGVVMPMWLAEGMAQYMFPETKNDFWDSHRDMLLRDRVLHNGVLSLKEMGSFGKRGIGNELVYNHGYAFAIYLTERFGVDVHPKLAEVLSSPMQSSVNTALKKVTGISGEMIHTEWETHLKHDYSNLTKNIIDNTVTGEVILDAGTTQIYPQWSGDSLIYYLSNEGRDYFSQTALYVYNLSTGERKLLKYGVSSKVEISPNNDYLYYSRKSKPDKHGSVYYDIYKLNLQTNKEEEVTKWRRAYNPSLSPDGEKIVFVTGEDGTSNLILLDLTTMGETALTDFDDGIQIFSSHWSPDGEEIAFDYLIDHGRNISIYDLKTKSIYCFDNNKYDTRNPYFSPDGEWLYFASDETGIYNIYRQSLTTGERELVTNVLGGAFMPSLNSKGELVYSLFDDSSFKISLLSEVEPVETEKAVYSNYVDTIPGLMEVSELNHPEPEKYHDQFSKFFILPTFLIDYGTFKPGINFFSDEIIERFNIFGGISVNSIKDRDIYLLLEYHQWEPTFFLEFYNITRNIFNIEETLPGGYPMSLDYTFELTEFWLGVSKPFSDINQLRFDMILSKYRTTTDEEIPSEGIYQSGFTYDYYRGKNFKLNWKFKKMIPTVNIDTNPDNGVEINTNIYRNYDKFIQGFKINETYSTLGIDFRDNNYWKIEQEGVWHHKFPLFSNLVGNFKWKFGWISKYDVDSFFYFFAGGMPGLRGYPFYSIEGRNLASFHYTLRMPIFREKNIQILPFNLQNAFIATYFEAGNAWSKVSNYPALDWGTFIDNPIDVTRSVLDDFKRDIGFQLRFSGFSFYAYPTFISLDLVYGIDEFDLVGGDSETYKYGREWRTYLTILFGL